MLYGPDGYSIYDRGSLVSTLTPGTGLGSFSGPYISRWDHDAATDTNSEVVSTVDGTQVATFDTSGVLSGSRFISIAEASAFGWSGQTFIPNLAI